MPRRVASILVLLLLAGVLHADEPAKPLAPSEAADRAVELWKAKDDAALKALAAQDNPDPWRVAEDLCARDEGKAASAFARAAVRPDTAKLAAYIDGAALTEATKKRRKTLETVAAAIKVKRHAEALKLLDAAAPLGDDVPSVRLLFARALALLPTGKRAEAIQSLGQAAAKAETVGWLAAASQFHDAAAKQARAARDAGVMETHYTAKARIEGLRGRESEVAEAWWALGTSFTNLRRPGDAFEPLEKAAAIQERLGDTAELGHTWSSIGIAHYHLKDWEKAGAAFRKAGDLHEAAGNTKGALAMKGNLGAILHSTHHYDEALVVYDEIVDKKRELGDVKGAADTLFNIAQIHEIKGDLERSLAGMQEVLAVHTKRKDEQWIAHASASVGVLLYRLGRYAESLTSKERALQGYRAIKDPHGEAHALLNLGNVRMKLNDLDRATELYESASALASAHKILLVEARAALNLSSVLQSQGAIEEALAQLERAVPLHEQAQDVEGLALVRTNMGVLHREQGHTAKALEVHLAALDGFQKLGRHLNSAQLEWNVGHDYLLLGKLDEARGHLDKAAASARSFGARDVLVDALRSRTEVELVDGQHAAALAYAEQTIDEVRLLVQGQADEIGARAREQFAPVYDMGLIAAHATGDAAKAALFLERGRAGTLLEALGGRETMQRLVLPDELLAEEEAARKAEAMAVRAYATAAGQRSLRRLRATKKQVAAAQAQVEAVAEKIQRLQKSAAQVVYGHADSLDVLQKRLAPNQALVVYAWTYRGVYALVVTPDAARTVELGSTEAVGQACAAFDGRNVKQQPDAALAQLRALLAEPLALPEQTTEVLISPAGDLGYVPFALVFPKHVTVCVPSGTTHGLLREQGALRGEQVLAVGDPNYGAKPTGAASRHRGAWRGRLTPLPATRTEVEAVGTVKLLGDRATEAGVRAAVAGRTRWRAIHFACHGLVDPEQPSLSCLALTPHGQDDGFLTCHDVFRQPMPADLVVLSACETGRGKVYAAEGIVGLTRAFMFAGAPRVICSLWKVDDDATRALMVEFYRLWQANAEKGLSAAQALKQAQEYVRTFEREEVDREASRKARRTVMRKVRPWQHPYYWAAWVLWGLPE